VSATERQQRLAADYDALESLRRASTILEFETTGSPPESYSITFRGKGLRRDAGTNEIVYQDLHQCELRQTLSYPRHPPDIRWLTPLFHPNISFGGFIRLEDIGLPWTEDLSLDIVCERLWDVARLAYHDVDAAANYAARTWLQQQSGFSLPVDARALRDKVTSANTNVIGYRRKGDQRLAFAQPEADTDILYIDEDTPIPPVKLGRPRRRKDGGDVLFIGD
jgi:ubiquitin-protein ligase